MPIAKTGSRARFRHERLKSPKAFDPRSFRTKRVKASRVVVGCPKGKYSPSTGRCKVGMKAQAVLRPKRNPQVISREKYKSLKKHGYVSKSPDGQLYMLTMDKKTGGTVLVPVEVEKKAKATSRIRRNARGTRENTGLAGITLTRSKARRGLKIQNKKHPEWGIWVVEGKTKGVTGMLDICRSGNRNNGRILDEGEFRDWAIVGDVLRGLRNPRKKWYYGPSLTHRGKVLVFPSSRTPTKGTHGRKIKYAVGPFKTSEEAGKKAKYAKITATGR